MSVKLPSFDVEIIHLSDFNSSDENQKYILDNLMNFTKLKKLDCSGLNRDLTEFPKNLPISLIDLDISYNNISVLPNLKYLTSLDQLECSHNNLTKISELPDTLTQLCCDENNLIELLNLPSSLEFLNCSNNELTELCNLPNSLEYLYCVHNKLIKLPDLPSSLTPNI